MIARRIFTFVLLFVFWAGAVGLPIPQLSLPLGDASFPCRGHGCGCLDAEMCRTNCCCFPEFSAAARAADAKAASTPSCCSAKKANKKPIGLLMNPLSCRRVDSLAFSLPPLDWFRDLRVFEERRADAVPSSHEAPVPLAEIEPVTPPPRFAV
ncbi:MAG: hypothetical protein H6819_01710 [Phycisphaerales bacterium]|nr:hypothetical protein [Phycisphaerales bacterium]MCB9857074.1 hypothetical protein [Phycisphaerales bacterium]MCB9861799.1 hypothetical protein [Phycisphaerales bacterium]